ncbi:hypothetical protein [Anaerosporobacter sp.]|nr:hypothetical protein [Anaerosporobacter sp.]
MILKNEEPSVMMTIRMLYDVWAWYQWEGKRKRRDIREGGHAKRG